MNQTDAYGDIVNFNEFNADGSQWMGGRYPLPFQRSGVRHGAVQQLWH